MKVAFLSLMLILPVSAQDVRWEKTLMAAKARAKAEHKMILLDLWAEWCGPCQALKKNVFPTPEAQAALKGVVALDELVELRDRTPVAEGTDLARTFNLRAFPSLFLLDAEGNLVRSHVGYVNPEELARFVHGS